MAELVQLHLERTLPELEEMERVGLFSAKEIKQIIKRRKTFEYRINKNQKKKEDFLKYIEFEVDVLSLVKKRRERLQCEYKQQEIDHSIATRINQLFKTVIFRFQNDVTLWLNQIKFCQSRKWRHTVSALYTRMLQVHSLSPSLWIMAAKWEIEENFSPENARLLLQRGLRFNENTDALWREYFRMELMYSNMIRQEIAPDILLDTDVKKNENDAISEGKIAVVVYRNAVKAIDDVNFALSFIQICQDFDFTKKIIDHIFEDVQLRHSDKEETFDALSKRPLLFLQEEIAKGKKHGLKKSKIVKEAEEDVILRYEGAVSQLNTEKMWSMYIQFLLSRLKAAKKEKKRLKLRSHTINVMQKAVDANCLSCDLYSEWARLLYDNGAEDLALSASITAAKKWNKVSFWLLCLTLHIQVKKTSNEVWQLFNEALIALNKKESFPVWQMGVEWLSLFDPSKIVEFFENGIKECREISVPLKEMYLESTAMRSGIQAARDLYKKLQRMYPISPELFKKMILIENTQLKPSIKWLRSYYEDAIREYGSSNVEFWLNYMKLEVEHQDGNPASYGMLYWKAMKTLEDTYTNEFITRITLYATGHGLSTNWEIMA